MISLENRLAICDASSLLWQAIKCDILENLSTTTNMESWPLFVRANPNIKSILISSHGVVVAGKGVCKPWGLNLDLDVLHLMQHLT
jgi:hypothetical protein